jgi:hypothetical protein
MRRFLAAALPGLLLTSTLWVCSPAHADSGWITFDSGVASTSHPVLSARVHPRSLYGDYTLTWYLEKDGYAVPGRSGTASGTLGTTSVYQTDPFDVAATELDDGTYYVVGTITVVKPEGTGTQIDTFNESFLVDFTGPAVTSLTTSPAVFYPRISATIRVPGYSPYVSITPGAGSTGISGYDVVKGSTQYASIWPSGRIADWDGRTSGQRSAVVPEGTYKIVPRDDHGNTSPVVAQVTVSHKRLIRHTWSRTASPQSSVVERYVGQCSSLRQPARAGWRGSFGYYSNTRCKTKSAKKTSVSTVHSIRLPAAIWYAGLHVDTYGGGARTKPHSAAVVRYLGVDNRWLSEKRLSGKLVQHAGPSVSGDSLRRFLFKNREFVWNLVTGYGNRYDVRTFTVVLSYYVLE